jgi:hypothetical protein
VELRIGFAKQKKKAPELSLRGFVLLVGRARLATRKLRFRTRDQRIKRSHGSSKTYIDQCLAGA